MTIPSLVVTATILFARAILLARATKTIHSNLNIILFSLRALITDN